MDTVYPAGASALARGRRLRRGPQRARTRTQPVTFAEIKEVDEEAEDAGEACSGQSLRVSGDGGGGGGGGAEERRRRDELVAGAWREPAWSRADVLALEPAAPLARQFVESRRRRARRDVIPEPPEEGGGGLPRSSSEPRVHAAP